MDFWSLALNFALSVLIGELLRPRQQFDRPAAAGIDEFNFPTATENRPVAVPFGTPIIKAPNCTWWGDYAAEALTKHVRTSLFGGGEDIFLAYRYSVGMELGLCISGNVLLRKVLADDKVLWSGTVGHGQTFQASCSWQEGELESGMNATCEFYSPYSRASAAQSAYMGTQVTVNPGYQHLTRVVWRGPSAGGSGFVGLSQSMKALSFVVYRMPSVVSLGVPINEFAAWADINGSANLAYIALELLANPDWGAGYPLPLIDLDSFRQAAPVLFAESNGGTFLWDGVRPVESMLEEVLRQANGIIVEDPSTGLLRLRLVRKGQAVAIVIDDSNLARIDSFSRAAGEEATNEVRLPFKDRSNDYKDRGALAQDLGGIRQVGQVISTSVQYPLVDNAALASMLVCRDLQAGVTPLAKAGLKINVPPGTVLLPGDLADVTLSDLGVTNMHMRVLKVSIPAGRKPELTLDLVQDVFTAGTSLYAASVPALGGSATTSERPGPANWNFLATFAPYGLTFDSAYEHPLFMAGAPTTGYKGIAGYRLGYWTNANTAAERTAKTTQWSGNGLTNFAVKGALTAPLARTSLAAFTINIAAQDVELITRGAGRDVFVLLQDSATGTAREFMRARVALVAGNTTATITPSARGLWDTQPWDVATGSLAYVMYGFAIDPEPMTFDSSVSLTKDTWARSQSNGPGGLQDFDAAGVAQRDAHLASGIWLGQRRTSLPYPAADMRLNGVQGQPKDGPVASLPAVNVTSLALTWKPRNRGSTGDSSWTKGDDKWESGTVVGAAIAYFDATGQYVSLGETSSASGSMFVGTTKVVPLGSKVVAAVRVTLPDGTSASVFHYFQSV